MQAIVLQDWITIRGAQQTSGSPTPVNQVETDWLDLLAYQDVVVWLHVAEFTLGGATSITVNTQTAASKDDIMFANMSSAQVTTTGVGVSTIYSGSAAQALARWVRWQIVPTTLPSTGAWDITLRIFLSCNAPGPGARPSPATLTRQAPPMAAPSIPLHLQAGGGNNLIYTGAGNLRSGPSPGMIGVNHVVSGNTGIAVNTGSLGLTNQPGRGSGNGPGNCCC